MSEEGFRAVGNDRYRVKGRMSFDTAGVLWERSKQDLRGPQPLVVDLGAVTEVDSAGLALLIEWANWARQRGFELRFTGFPDKLRALARLSEVEGLLGLGASPPG